MVDDSDVAGTDTPGGGERVLNQDEIDSLLGFDLDEQSLTDSSGIRALIDSAMVSYERLPMLEIVFDRLVRLLTTSLRNFTSDNVEVSLDNISTMRFGDYLNSMESAAARRLTRRPAICPRSRAGGRAKGRCGDNDSARVALS